MRRRTVFALISSIFLAGISASSGSIAWANNANLTAAEEILGSARTLVPHKATYKIKISIASGTLETDVRQTDDGFSAQSVIQPSGFASLLMRGAIKEHSEFRLSESGVRPVKYQSDDGLSNDKAKMDFAFDWDNEVVAGTVNDVRYEYPLDSEVHDRVSIQYQLMHNLLAGSSGENYSMLDGDELKELSITTIGTREIKVPFGKFDAVGIRHQAANSKRVTTLWCAEKLGYLPVLIEQHRRGKRRVRAVLTNYVATDNPQ